MIETEFPTDRPAAWTDAMISFLNEVLDRDPVAMAALLRVRVRCNEALANHPTMQSYGSGEEGRGDGEYAISILGLLNGFCGLVGGEGEVKDYGPITAHVDLNQSGQVVYVRGFTQTDAKP